MKNKIKLIVMSLLVLAMVTALVVLFPGATRLEADTREAVQKIVDVSAVNWPAHLKDNHTGNPALESVLNRLLSIYESEGEAAAAEFAARRNIPYRAGQLKVVVEAAPFVSPLPFGQSGQSAGSEGKQTREMAINQSVSLIRAGIESLGGHLEKARHSMVRCTIALQSLDQLARLANVRSVRRPVRMRPHVVSEGVQKTGAHLYHDLAAFKSTGVKVCVLDVGFEGYMDLLGTELPDSVTARSFTEEGDIEAGEYHGTACAEIVHDMAPGAELYLANIFYDSDLIDAVEWLVNEQVDVVSFSLGSYFGAGDGTGLDCTLVQWAYQNSGITWVASAGNAANDHWSGTFSDPDGDGWHNFSGEDELLQFYVPVDLGIEHGVNAELKWNDWGTWDDYYGYSGSDQDYDLYLFIWNGDQWQLVDKSENRQPQFIWPWESIYGWYSLSDTYWGVAIRKNQASEDVFFDLYVDVHTPDTMEYNVPSGTISTPADSPYAIAVGAVDAVDDSYHYYSSQGPTADGRIKPDIVAPSGVSTSNTSYGLLNITGGFAGTSASCPHMAGAIALLKGKTPFTLDEIKSILYNRAIEMGEPGKDNVYGWGRLDLHR
jgi:hypothetical protein